MTNDAGGEQTRPAIALLIGSELERYARRLRGLIHPSARRNHPGPADAPTA
jgi:hypothetical protein